jgi:glycosyltransferase involved in cell wall biosynthesis
MAGAHVVVAPSLGGESFGVVLIEAMAAGAVILCADLPGYRLAGGEVPVYFPPGNRAALARLLEQLLTVPLGHAARSAGRSSTPPDRAVPDPDVASEEVANDDLPDREERIAEGRARAAGFTFASLAHSYRELYELARST